MLEVRDLIRYLKRVAVLVFPLKGFLLYLQLRCCSWIFWRFLGQSQAIPDSLNLLFVSGPPRSGTTMLQSALMRHPDICGFANETNFFSQTNPLRADFAPLSSAVSRSILCTSSSIYSAYIELARQLSLRRGSLVVSEKTPQHCFQASKIYYFLPGSKFIFIIRDPYSCVSSMMSHSSFIPQGLSVERSALYWVRSIIAIQNFLAQNSQSAMLLKYEQICDQPSESSRVVCDFLGIAQYDFFSAPSASMSSDLHTFTGKEGFSGINMPPSKALSKPMCLSESSANAVKKILDRFSISYDSI